MSIHLASKRTLTTEQSGKLRELRHALTAQEGRFHRLHPTVKVNPFYYLQCQVKDSFLHILLPILDELLALCAQARKCESLLFMHDIIMDWILYLQEEHNKFFAAYLVR